MEKNYDVILVGAGPAGIFCAYELITKNKDLKVLLVEKGNDIYYQPSKFISNRNIEERGYYYEDLQKTICLCTG